jgi:hypothetical protein
MADSLAANPVTGHRHDDLMTRDEQLCLLPDSHQPVELRLDERTRRIGLQGVAKARAVLAAQAERRAQHHHSEAA